jgi:hypothetical protein
MRSRDGENSADTFESVFHCVADFEPHLDDFLARRHVLSTDSVCSFRSG